MARSDLLLALVEAAVGGNSLAVRRVAEAIAAEERAKRHSVVANRIDSVLASASSARNGSGFALSSRVDETRGISQLVFEREPNRTLDSLKLSSPVRRVCEELIEEQLRADVLRSFGLEPRHKLLLTGPPGNGKTSLAEAIAEALALPFLAVRYEAVIGSFLGETASRLGRVFDAVRSRPCLLFFDEFDSIGKERGDSHETGEIKRVVSSLLLQIDSLPSWVVVVAASNHPELLDRAAWRRFEVRMDLPMPTKAQLASFIVELLTPERERLKPTGAAIARRLGHISYAEARDFCLTVKRRHVLALGSTSVERVIEDQLKLRRQLQSLIEDTTHGQIEPTEFVADSILSGKPS